jgi:methionine-rich copper-binding protein CopC
VSAISARRGHRVARLALLAAAGGLLATVSVLGLATPAQAHNYLVDSTPEVGGTLTELPESFSITTNEALLDLGGEGAGFALEVIDADGLYYGDGCVTVSGTTMTVTPAIGAPGDYTVVWQVVSADGHTVSDEFPFVWAPTDASVATEGSAAPATCGAADAPDSPSDPVATDAPDAAADSPANANLSDVLWIGGTVVLVGLAVGITLVVSGRKKKN